MNRLLLLLGLTVAIYSTLWSAGFVWDDIPLIVQNQALSNWSPWSIFASDLWADSGAGEVASGYYRPLVLFSFAVDRALFGLDPGGYHIHSLCWHLVAVVGLYRLFREPMGADAALVAASLFALHPAQSEVVSWIAARNDLMAAAFGFFALGVVWDGEKPTLKRWVTAFLLTVLACLSKETAFVLPVLLITADAARRQMSGIWVRCSALVVGVACVVVIRALLGVGGATLPSTGGWILLFNSFVGWAGSMGGAFLSPWPLSSARDLTWVSLISPLRVGVGVLFWVALLTVVSVSQGKRRRLMMMGLAWLILLLAVTLVPTADKGGFGDRFLYWPMAGLAVIFGICCASWWRLAIPVLVIPAAIILQLRLPDWAHDRALWGAAIRDVPTPTNELSLGHALTLHSRHKRAHVNFVSALAGRQIDLEACSPVVGSAMRSGLSEHAFRMGQWAVARGCPKTGVLNGWMATAAAMAGNWGDARVWAQAMPADPKGRSRVVQAAWARRTGDDAGYSEIESGWSGERPLEMQVESLLRANEIRSRGR